MKEVFEQAKRFVYRNARPLELARWQFSFENVGPDAVLHALEAYQNADGGFGHGLEPDFWNPNSTPIATWAATQHLREIGWTDPTHPLVQGILRYLDSGADFDAARSQWRDVVESNNRYPSAVWWRCSGKGSQFQYNPTASLAGFGLRFAAPDSPLYARCVLIAQESLEWLEANVPFDDAHVTNCFVSLYEDCAALDANILNLKRFGELLVRQVNHVICREQEKWFTDYQPRPSDFIHGRNSLFLNGNEALVQDECALICTMQDEDGGFPVNWKWWTEYDREFAISTNWWRASFAVDNMRFLRAFQG